MPIKYPPFLPGACNQFSGINNSIMSVLNYLTLVTVRTPDPFFLALYYVMMFFAMAHIPWHRWEHYEKWKKAIL